MQKRGFHSKNSVSRVTGQHLLLAGQEGLLYAARPRRGKDGAWEAFSL